MNTHRVTNTENRKFIEVDSKDFSLFFDKKSKGDKSCEDGEYLYCNDCPVFVAIAGSTGGCQSRWDALKVEEIEPVEKTYNLLDLEEGVIYSCDEAPDRARLKRVGFELKYKYSEGAGAWVIVSDVFKYKTFRKIQKDLTFKDLIKGEKYKMNLTEGQFICIHEDHAIFWIKSHLCSVSVNSEKIKDWTKA